MNNFNPFTDHPEMRRRYRSFQAMQRIVLGLIVVVLTILSYVGYKLLSHFGIL